jgi:hypothetical protein
LLDFKELLSASIALSLQVAAKQQPLLIRLAHL